MSASIAPSTARLNTASTHPARLRITRRGRVVLGSLVALALAVGASVFALNIGSASATGASGDLDYVQVSTGQSLWQLAESIAPDADPRDVVSDLVHFNQLDSADVQPGQRLAVPASYAN